MWLLIETNTSKSELLTEYWLSSFSNILILKNAIYSFVLGLWGVTYSVKVFESCSSKFGLSSSCCFELPCPISFFGPRTLAHSVCWSSWKGGGEENNGKEYHHKQKNPKRKRNDLGTLSEKKRWRTPSPPPPSLGIFAFFYRFFKIFFCHFISPWIGKNREKYGVGLGQTPPPPLGIFPT